MLKFLKNLFGEKEEKKEEVNFFELAKWIEPKVWQEIRLDFSELKVARDSLVSKAEELQKKNLDNAMVEARIKDVVKGNRNALVINLRQLVSKTEPPSDFSAKKVLGFCDIFYAEMDDFNKRTARNYFISKHLIGEELDEIRKSLKSIEDIVRRIHRKTAEGRVMLLEDVQEKLRDIYSYVEEKGKRAETIRENEQKLKDLLDKEKMLAAGIEKIKDGAEFASLEKLKQEKEEAGKDIEKIKARIREEFAEISRPLKKFAKFKDVKAVDSWLENPVEAVENHSDKISGILRSAAESMSKNEIDSKNPEKDIQKMHELAAKSIELKDSLAALEETIKMVNSKIKENKVEEEKDKLIAELNNAEKEIAETEEKIESIKEKNIHEDIAKIKEDLKRAGFRVEMHGIPFE